MIRRGLLACSQVLLHGAFPHAHFHSFKNQLLMMVPRGLPTAQVSLLNVAPTPPLPAALFQVLPPPALSARQNPEESHASTQQEHLWPLSAPLQLGPLTFFLAASSNGPQVC